MPPQWHKVKYSFTTAHSNMVVQPDVLRKIQNCPFLFLSIHFLSSWIYVLSIFTFTVLAFNETTRMTYFRQTFFNSFFQNTSGSSINRNVTGIASVLIIHWLQRSHSWRVCSTFNLMHCLLQEGTALTIRKRIIETKSVDRFKSVHYRFFRQR